MQAALGFRTHSGWAAAVAITLTENEPTVCDRRMIVLADADVEGSKQPYHHAEPLPIAKAKEHIRRCVESSQQLALSSVAAIVDSLRDKGYETVACGILGGAGRMAKTVEAILASHAAIHTAEGEMYRDAVTWACETLNLSVLRVPEKQATDVAEKTLRVKRKQVEAKVNRLGKSVGAPWTRDQKLATIAAWVALESRGTPKRATAAGRKA